MAPNAPFCMKLMDLVPAAARMSMGVTGQQSRLSMPIPTGQGGQPHYLFIASPTLSRPGQPTVFSAPNVLLRVAVSGAFLELRAVTPADLGFAHAPGEPIGSDGLPPGLTVEQERQHFERLWELGDLVIPAFFGLASGSGGDVHAACREFRDLHALLSEVPFRPYYQALGQTFFGWLAQASR